MREVAALASVFVLAVGTVWYCHLITGRRVRPVPATWIIAGIATSISFAAYWDTPKHTWFGNITNLGSAGEIWIVVAVLFWTLWRDGKLVVEFDWFQIGCLLVSGFILAGWKLTDQADLAFWLIQALMLVAYLPTVSRLIKWNKNFDSSVIWGAITLASAFGLVPAVLDGDGFGVANSLRALFSSGLTCGIMLRLDYAEYVEKKLSRA